MTKRIIKEFLEHDTTNNNNVENVFEQSGNSTSPTPSQEPKLTLTESVVIHFLNANNSLEQLVNSPSLNLALPESVINEFMTHDETNNAEDTLEQHENIPTPKITFSESTTEDVQPTKSEEIPGTSKSVSLPCLLLSYKHAHKSNAIKLFKSKLVLTEAIIKADECCDIKCCAESEKLKEYKQQLSSQLKELEGSAEIWYQVAQMSRDNFIERAIYSRSKSN